MTTRTKVPRAQQLHSVLWIVAMLVMSVVVSGRAIQASRCPDQKSAAGAWTTLTPTASTPPQAARPAADRNDDAPVATGLDLEVRIWNVRIGFPWLKSLPLTPGRHIVVSLWETDSGR